MGQIESDVNVRDLGSSGTPVRTLSVTTLVSDVATTTKQQVINIADEYGNVLTLIDDMFQHEMLKELKAIRLGLEHIVGQQLRGDV
jgi:hypothetical protein